MYNTTLWPAEQVCNVQLHPIQYNIPLYGRTGAFVSQVAAAFASSGGRE